MEDKWLNRKGISMFIDDDRWTVFFFHCFKISVMIIIGMCDDQPIQMVNSFGLQKGIHGFPTGRFSGIHKDV